MSVAVLCCSRNYIQSEKVMFELFKSCFSKRYTSASKFQSFLDQEIVVAIMNWYIALFQSFVDQETVFAVVNSCHFSEKCKYVSLTQFLIVQEIVFAVVNWYVVLSQWFIIKEFMLIVVKSSCFFKRCRYVVSLQSLVAQEIVFASRDWSYFSQECAVAYKVLSFISSWISLLFDAKDCWAFSDSQSWTFRWLFFQITFFSLDSMNSSCNMKTFLNVRDLQRDLFLWFLRSTKVVNKCQHFKHIFLFRTSQRAWWDSSLISWACLRRWFIFTKVLEHAEHESCFWTTEICAICSSDSSSVKFKVCTLASEIVINVLRRLLSLALLFIVTNSSKSWRLDLSFLSVLDRNDFDQVTKLLFRFSWFLEITSVILLNTHEFTTNVVSHHMSYIFISLTIACKRCKQKKYRFSLKLTSSRFDFLKNQSSLSII